MNGTRAIIFGVSAAFGLFLIATVIMGGSPQRALAACPATTPTPTASPTATASPTPTASPSPTSTSTSTSVSSAIIGYSAGTLPPLSGGFGTFAFCGGPFADLLATSGCPMSTSVFFYNKPDGSFAVWIPGTTVAAANAEILAIFPGDAVAAGTIFIARCV
jgi:hypothetical protein